MALRFDSKTGEWVGETGGVNLQELAAREPSKKAEPKTTSPAEIRYHITSHEIYGYADRLARFILDQYEISAPVIFTNRQASCVTTRAGKSTVRFGYQSLTDSCQNGFREYSSVAHVWTQNGYNPKSYWLKAVWMEVLHEVAHVIQRDGETWNTRSLPHGSKFQSKLNELIVLFPYQETLRFQK